MIQINDLRGDMVLSSCLRYDLAPIPVTLEADIRTAPETGNDYGDGKIIKVNEIDFRIVKSEPLRNAGGGMQGKYPLSAVRITAFPEGVVNVALPRRAAVIFQNTSFANIYRSCGATVGVTGDFVIGRFAVFVGGIPTFQLAQVLQEESAVMLWKQNKVHVLRLRDLMAQEPVSGIAVESSEDVQSSFLERDQIPVYFSVGSDGQFVSGERRNPAQVARYSPRKNLRELNFMGRVLVRRKVLTGEPNLTIRAGDLVDVRGTPLVVMTAAHYSRNNADGGGAAQYPRFWLGSPA